MTLVKDYVKKRDRNICQWCGKKVSGSNCQASHVIPVSANDRLSFDPLNIKVLCYMCHLRIWHKNPILAYEWFKSKFPERLKYLKKNNNKKSYSENELLELIEKWKSNDVINN